MIWWTKFLVCRGMDIDPLPISSLEHHHSEIKILELFPANDSKAFEKFLSYAGTAAYDDTVIIVRNAWGAYPDNKLKDYTNLDHFRKVSNLSQEYWATHWNMGKKPSKTRANLSEVLDYIEDKETGLTGLLFDYTFLEKDMALQEAYKDLWTKLDPSLGLLNRIWGKKGKSHTFLYNGNGSYAPLHAAYSADYFVQVANTKRWYFINKRYFPYAKVKRTGFGIVNTYFYKSKDYPAPGIPYTTFDLHPGDLLYFDTFHLHEVENLEDTLGFAIGIRPIPPGSFYDRFAPLLLYNTMNMPWILYHMGSDSSTAQLAARGKCIGSQGPYTYAYNGSKVTRWDYREVDGECTIYEKDPDYQRKEMLGEWEITDYHPYIRSE